jgi:hypothetical protein
VLHQGVLNVIFRDILELDVLIISMISLIDLIKVLVAGIASSLLSIVKIDGGWRIGRDGGLVGNYVSSSKFTYEAGYMYGHVNVLAA